MPNITNLFGRGSTPQPHHTIVSHAEVLQSGTPIAESRNTENGATDDVVMEDTAEEQLQNEVEDAIPATPKSAKATPKPAAKSAKPVKSAKPKLPAKKTKATEANTTTWKGETGPDNAVGVDSNGEQEWEVAKICAIEEDGKTIVVQWKGWKGFWPEDYDTIKTAVPDLVKEFKASLKGKAKDKKEKAAAEGGAKRGRPAGAKNAAKPTKAPKTARAVVAAKAKANKITKSPKTATGPKKATPKSPSKKTAAPTKSPKKATTKASGSRAGAKLRGRPKKSA
jgi:hypothetical protein